MASEFTLETATKIEILQSYLRAPVETIQEFFQDCFIKYSWFLEGTRADKGFVDAWLVANRLKSCGSLEKLAPHEIELFERIPRPYRDVITAELDSGLFKPYNKSPKPTIEIGPEAIAYSPQIRKASHRRSTANQVLSADAKKHILRVYLQAPVRTVSEFFKHLVGVSEVQFRKAVQEDEALADVWYAAVELKRYGSVEALPSLPEEAFQRLGPDYKTLLETAIASGHFITYTQAATSGSRRSSNRTL